MVCFGSRDASAAIVDVDGLYGRRTDGGLLPTVRPRRLHFHDEQVWDAEFRIIRSGMWGVCEYKYTARAKQNTRFTYYNTCIIYLHLKSLKDETPPLVFSILGAPVLPAAAQADAALAAVAQRSHVELRAVMFSRHSQAPNTVRTRVGELRAAGGTVRFVAEDSRSQQDGQQDEVCAGAAELLLNQEQAAPPARPSRIPSLCTHFTRAGIEWRRWQHAVCMARPYKEPRHSGQAEP